MCQLCGIKTATKDVTWPKPLRTHIPDIDFLVTSVHDEYEVCRTKSEPKSEIKSEPKSESKSELKSEPKSSKPVAASDSLLDLLRTLNTLLDQVEIDREKWWTSPQKRERRRILDEECNQKVLSEIHKVNNKTIESIEGLKAKLGYFVKWSLGMNGGTWELGGSEGVKEVRKRSIWTLGN